MKNSLRKPESNISTPNILVKGVLDDDTKWDVRFKIILIMRNMLRISSKFISWIIIMKIKELGLSLKIDQTTIKSATQ